MKNVVIGGQGDSRPRSDSEIQQVTMGCPYADELIEYGEVVDVTPHSPAM
jgi:hypothetical protein